MMVDIETLGTSPDSVILEISTILFTDVHGIRQTSPATYIFDHDRQIVAGRTRDKATMNWWKEKLSDKSYAPQDKIYLELLLNNKSVNISPMGAYTALTESLTHIVTGKQIGRAPV